MTNVNDIFINYKRKPLPVQNGWPCSNVALLRFSFGVPLFLLGLLYRALKSIRCAFLDEASGKTGREEGSKVMRKYTWLRDINAFVHEAGIVVSRAYVHEAMNMSSLKKPCNVIVFNFKK